MHIPFLDLNAHHAWLRHEIADAIEEVIDAGDFSGGTFVEGFESDFAGFCESRFALGVGSGTEALWLALTALGVGPGDEVITVPMTFFATAEAISRTGARPVFVDIEASTYTMDPALLANAITPRTKAIIPVHLFGQMADMTPILDTANQRGVPVIEDAAQAHGARYDGRRAGTLGIAGCFSFYPGKNLGALGEAGAVVTSDPRLADRIRILRNHGQLGKHEHEVIGWNCRMDGIQGAILRLKLRRLELNNDKRRQIAAEYEALLKDVPNLSLPRIHPHRTHIYHLYAIRVIRRDDFIRRLGSMGICCGVHYPVPVHLQKAYAGLGYFKGSFPIAEQCATQFVSLPMFPELRHDQITAVAQAVQVALCDCLAA